MTELFRLIGKVSIDNSSANESIDETVEKAEESQGRLSSIGRKISGGLASIAKVAAGFIATVSVAAGGALIAMSTQAVQCYADYEQLIGGVETLFGAGGQSIEEYAASVGKSVEEVRETYNNLMTAQDTVVDHAKEAFRTAGLSANDYMETVTSFSAALISSLNGDTVKAADIADKAIIDMSDNANKMGSSMESIQNAYQGFAKQNYTMLDNLKLGYGGTKTEMERLLADANELNKQQGIITEYSIENFADIVEAIHVVQTNMGITGTTSKEAATTIQGSIGMMKAAWTNFLTGMADPDQDFDALLGNLVDSVVTVADNLIPRIAALLPRLVSGLSQLAQSLARYIPNIVSQLLPALISGVSALVGELITAIPAILQVLVPVLFSSISEILSSVAGMLAGSGAVDALTSVFSDEFVESMKEWIPYLTDISALFAQDTVSMFAGKLGTLKDMFVSAYQAIRPFAEALLTGVVRAIDTLLVIWNNVFLPALSFGIDIFTQLAATIINSIVPAVQRISEKFNELSQFVSAAIQNYIVPLVSSFIQMIQELWEENQDKLTLIGELFSTIFNAIADKVTWFVDTFKNYIYPFLAWLCETVQSNMGNIKSIFQSAFDIIGGIVQFFTALFQGDWSGMWEAVKSILAAGRDYIVNIFNTIGSFLSSIGSAIWSIVTNAFENVRTAISNKVNAAKEAVEEKFNKIKNSIKEKSSEALNHAKEKFESIKENISEKVEAAKNKVKDKFGEIALKIQEKTGISATTVADKFESIKKSISDKVGSAYSTVSTKFGDIANKISEKMNSAKETVSNVIDKIKGFFDFEWKLPDLKLPHFSINPSGWKIGDLLEGVIPSLGIEWYANGGVMTKPTAFGLNGNRVMVGGEAGAEAIAPIDVLQCYIAEAVAGQNGELLSVLTLILRAVCALDDNMGGNLRKALEGLEFKANEREIARLVKAVK